MTCSICRQAQRDWPKTNPQCNGIETVDECKRATQKVPKLLKDNEEFVFLLYKVLPVLCDGFGGFKHDAIEYLMDMHKVPEGQRPIIFDRFLIVIDVIREVREKERKK